MTNAVYANPQAVSTYVMSATQRRFGAGAVKSRRSRSAGRWLSVPGTVVRGRLRLAQAPAIPSSRISRSTVHRATPVPSRRSCSQTFRAPYTRRPFFRSSHTRDDLPFQPLIPLLPARRLTLALLRRVIRRDREFQDRAGRLHPEPVTM